MNKQHFKLSNLTLSILMVLLFSGCNTKLLLTDRPSEKPDPEAGMIAEHLVLIRGVMGLTGKKLKSIDPIKLKVNRNKMERPFPDYESGIFYIEIIYQNGVIQKVPFSALGISDKDTVRHGYFELYIPIYDQLKASYIKTTKNQITLHQFNIDHLKF